MDPVDSLFAGAPQAPAAGAAAPAQPDPHAAVDALFAGAKPAAQTPSKPGVLNYLKDAGGVLASAAFGLLPAIAGGYAGAKQAFTGHPDEGADTVRRIENAGTYQARTPAGQLAQKILGYIPEKISEFGDWAGNQTSNAMLYAGTKLGLPEGMRDRMAAGNGAMVNAGINVLPLLAERLLGISPKVAAPVARVAPEVAAARSADFKLTPNQAMAQGGGLGRMAESLAGHAKLERQVSRENAPTVTKAAAQEVGIDPATTAAQMPTAIRDAKAPHNAVYDEISQLGQIPTDKTYQGIVGGKTAPGAASFPAAADPRIAALRNAYSVPAFDAGDAVAKIRELRQEGSARVYGGKYDPAESAYGQAQLAISRALENQIHRHLQDLSTGKRAPVTLEGVANNASGESAASQEAINRATQERASGQSRFLIDADGRPTPLTGVDAVDARATPGSIIVQRGIGAQPFTVLDRGGLPQNQASGLLARARALHGLDQEEPLQSRPQSVPPSQASSVAQDWQRQAADLIPRFRDARTALAKIKNFERAWKAGKGQAVSALNLGKQLERGAPLTGGLRTIAEAAQRYPRAFQDLSKIRDNGPFSNLDLKFAGPLAFLKPEAILPMLGPPGIRSLLASDRYQRRAFGPFKSPATPFFSGRSRLALPLTASSARSSVNAGNTQR